MCQLLYWLIESIIPNIVNYREKSEIIDLTGLYLANIHLILILIIISQHEIVLLTYTWNIGEEFCLYIIRVMVSNQLTDEIIM